LETNSYARPCIITKKSWRKAWLVVHVLHSRACQVEYLLHKCTAGCPLCRNFTWPTVCRSMAVRPLIFGGYKLMSCKRKGMLYFFLERTLWESILGVSIEFFHSGFSIQVVYIEELFNFYLEINSSLFLSSFLSNIAF